MLWAVLDVQLKLPVLTDKSYLPCTSNPDCSLKRGKYIGAFRHLDTRACSWCRELAMARIAGGGCRWLCAVPCRLPPAAWHAHRGMLILDYGD